MSSYTVPYIPNVKEIAPAVLEIQVLETRRIFFVFFFFFFFFTPNNKCVWEQTFHALISTKFGTPVALPKLYISTKFGMICSEIMNDNG